MKKDFIRFNTREYNQKHKLTVFLIAYNHENTIRDTIESILTQKQNCKHNFIVKILEDCSTDNTLKICQEYARKYPDLFELFAQPKNTHCEHIKNALINNLDTQYWCFIEGDDYYTDSAFFDKAIDFFEKHPDYNLFAGKHKLNTLNNEFTNTFKNQLFEPNKDLSLDNYVYCQTSARIYRNIFDFANMQEYPFIYDMYLYVLYLYVGKSRFYNKFVSVYRQTITGSWTHLNAKQQKLAGRAVVKKLISFYGFGPAQFFVKLYPKRTMQRLNRVFGAKITIRIIKIYESIFGKNL